MRFWAIILGLISLTALTAAASLLQSSAFAADGNRVALVIGNGKYAHVPTLANPANDARLMAEVLRNARFNVIEGIDLDYAALHDRLNSFTEASYDAELALIYYAGYGLQVDGKNYLVPVDAELTAPAHLKTRTVRIDELIAALPPAPAVGVIILDACRENPLARTLAASLPKGRSNTAPGLAPISITTTEAGNGRMLIAYATDPGAVCDDGRGANSLYATALARHFAEPGLEIQTALARVRSDVTDETNGRQRPWYNASLGREIVIEPAAPAVAAAQPPATPAPPASATSSSAVVPPPGTDSRAWEIERRVWDEASKRNTIAHYQAYLRQFPNGAFADLARLNLEQLKGNPPVVANTQSDTSKPAAAPEPPAATANPENDTGTELTESAIGLDREGKIDLQERLLAIGYNPGNADGNLGAATRRAIGVWQKENNLPQTTFLTRKQYVRLQLDTDVAVQSYRARRASEAEGNKLQGATSQAGKTEPVVGARPARPRLAARSKAALATHAPSARKSRFRNCSGIDGPFQVPASQKCPLSGYAHY